MIGDKTIKFDRLYYLERMGMVDRELLIDIPGIVKVRKSTVAEHRVICYETGILPVEVKVKETNNECLVVEIDESDFYESSYDKLELQDVIKKITLFRHVEVVLV